MNVRATEIWCSDQRRIPFVGSGCSKLQRMWWYERVWHQISWLDLILDEPVKTASYSAISNAWLKPQPRDRRNLTMGHTYTSLFLCAMFWTYLFPGRWFGHVWPTSLAPLTWPPRYPELTTPYNLLWDSINRRVSVPRCNTNEECHRAAKDVFRTNALTHVTEEIRCCVQHKGAPTDPLDK